MKNALMLVMMMLILIPVAAGAEMVDGVWFGVERKNFFFFNATWGLSCEDVKKILQDINRPAGDANLPLTQYVESGRAVGKHIPFQVRGKIVERDGVIDYICEGVKKNTCDYIFRFVFDDERLSTVYIKSIIKWKDPTILEFIKMNGGVDGYTEIFIELLNHCSLLNKSDKDFSIYECNINSLNKFYFSLPKNDKSAFTVWPAWTEMTRDKIYRTGSRLNSLTNKNTTERTEVEIQKQNIYPDKNNRDNIEFYKRSVLELLN